VEVGGDSSVGKNQKGSNGAKRRSHSFNTEEGGQTSWSTGLRFKQLGGVKPTKIWGHRIRKETGKTKTPKSRLSREVSERKNLLSHERTEKGG